jgi:hypothetical protein
MATLPAAIKIKTNGSINEDLSERLDRTGLSRWPLTCNSAGHYGIKPDSEGKYVFPFTCIPRGM